MAKKITKRQLEKIINEEIEAMQNEGMFTSAIKTAATNFLPGGRMVSHFARSQAFDRIEEKLEELEARLRVLEMRS